jgi:hypothetical protein
MNRAQRKRLGEFYTPLWSLGILSNDKGLTGKPCWILPVVLERLLKAFHAMVGSDMQRGLIEFLDLREVLSRIDGNDLNAFSSVLTQIQMANPSKGLNRQEWLP